MPAYRRQKLSCASLETSPKSKRQRKPRKEMTEEEKAEAEFLRLERKMKKDLKVQWEASLPQPWVPVDGFRWPAGTLGMYKSDAKRTYDLTDKDLSTLRYESIQGSPKTFFSHRHAKQLVLRKYTALNGLPSDDVWFGSIRLFKKTENPVRRTRTNWYDIEDTGKMVLKFYEDKEMQEIAEYAKKAKEEERAKIQEEAKKKEAAKLKRQQDAELKRRAALSGQS